MHTSTIKRTFWKDLYRFFEPCLANKMVLYKGLFVSFLWGINGIAHVIFLERLTYYLLNQSDSFRDMLFGYAIYIFSYEIINFSVRKWGWVELLGYTWKYISRQYLAKFVALDNSSVESIGTGKLVSIINTGIEQWGILVWDTIEHIVALTIALIFAMYVVSKIHFLYPIFFLALFIFFFLVSRFFNKKMVPYRMDRNENFIIITKQVVKILMSKNEVLQSNKIGLENRKIDDLYMRDVAINKSMGTLRALVTRNSGLGIAIVLLLSYFFLGYGYLEGRVELSVLVGLSGALIVVQKIISESLIFYIDFTKQFVKVSKLWDFFDSTKEIDGYESGNAFVYKRGDIQIRNISFGYGSGKSIFQNFDLSITGSQITAFVGSSGGGKTTLIKILAQYIRQNTGSIVVDGQDLSRVSLKSYYQHIGYLTQEPSIFDGSVYENLTYALADNIRTEGLMDRIKKVIKLSCCEFIYDFPDGLDTEIGERGVRLSGGQKQRLAIAKIMLKNPHIIILDEPTSALDSFSEELITTAMNNLFVGRTVLVIAHRLQTVKHAHEIFVLNNGQVTERGTHRELVAHGGIYAKMLELQSGF